VSRGCVSDSFSVSITFSALQRLASSDLFVQRGGKRGGRWERERERVERTKVNRGDTIRAVSAGRCPKRIFTQQSPSLSLSLSLSLSVSLSLGEREEAKGANAIQMTV